MKFEWDEQKNRINLLKHGIAFADVEQLFNSTAPLLVDLDDRFYEERWIGTGLIKNHVIIVIFTEPDPETIRIISARRADRYERQRYFSTFGK